MACSSLLSVFLQALGMNNTVKDYAFIIYVISRVQLLCMRLMWFFHCESRLRFLLGGRHGDFKFLPPPGYAPCYEAVLPRDRLRIEPIKEYKHDFDGVRNLLGPTQSLLHTAFTPCPVDTIQVKSWKNFFNSNLFILNVSLHWFYYPFRLYFLLIWSAFERSLQKIAMSYGLWLALNKDGPMDQ